jgi:chromosome segregation ATPase
MVIKLLIYGIVIASVLLALGIASMAQITTGKNDPVRSSPAYAELLLQKTELESTLESLLVDYTEEYPKIKGLRVELRLLQAEMDRLLAVKPENSSRLTLALGKLMLRKVELETELETLRAQYKDDHPDVKKAKRKVEVFESAIKEILG